MRIGDLIQQPAVGHLISDEEMARLSKESEERERRRQLAAPLNVYVERIEPQGFLIRVSSMEVGSTGLPYYCGTIRELSEELSKLVAAWGDL